MAKENGKKSIKYAPQYHAEVDKFRYDYKPNDPYHERAISRREIRGIYDEMYRNEQDRDERAFKRASELQNRFYGGIDPRRRQEIADSGMVAEDHRAIANLSERVIHRQYPKFPYYATPYVDSSVRSLNQEYTEPEGK